MIYLDHAATTAVDPRVVEAMLPYWTSPYGNPSSIYSFGAQAHAGPGRGAPDQWPISWAPSPARSIFTGCGTESDNLAIRGVAWAHRSQGQPHHYHSHRAPCHGPHLRSNWSATHSASRSTYRAGGQAWPGGPG